MNEYSRIIIEEYCMNHPKTKNLRNPQVDVFFRTEVHEADGRNIMLLGLDVLPEYRCQGLARELMRQYLEREKQKGRKRVVLTCLPDKVRMYEKFGFEDHGIGESVWGGEAWYEMSIILNE